MPAPVQDGALPYFNAQGDLVITAATDDQFKYWRDGAQSIWQTLADLSADAATVRRYAAKSDAPLHTQMGVRDCKGRLWKAAMGWFGFVSSVDIGSKRRSRKRRGTWSLCGIWDFSDDHENKEILREARQSTAQSPEAQGHVIREGRGQAGVLRATTVPGANRRDAAQFSGLRNQ